MCDKNMTYKKYILLLVTTTLLLLISNTITAYNIPQKTIQTMEETNIDTTFKTSGFLSSFYASGGNGGGTLRPGRMLLNFFNFVETPLRKISWKITGGSYVFNGEEIFISEPITVNARWGWISMDFTPGKKDVSISIPWALDITVS